MKRFISILAFVLCAIPAFAQNTTAVSGSKIVDASGSALQSGTVCFQPMILNGPAAGFGIGGGGIAYGAPVCPTVTSGSIPTFNIASSAYTSPVGIQYQIRVTDDISGRSWILGTTPISGASWSLDVYAPTNVTTLPAAPGPSSITGTLTATGAITAPAFHGLADTATKAIQWNTLPVQCPSGYSSSHFDISGNALDCNADSYQPSGTTTGVIAQSPAGSQLVNIPSGFFMNFGGAASHSSFDVSGNLFLPADPTASLGAVTKQYVDKAVPLYQAFGDSITSPAGNTLPLPHGSYPYKLASAWNGSVEDYGIPGSTSGQNDTFIFTSLKPSLPTALASYMIGTNNVSAGAANTDLQQDYGINILAQYAYLALPTSQILTAASTGSVSFTGTWSNEGLFGASDPGKRCTGTSCSVSVSGTGPILYLAVSQQAGNSATATLSCDGSATGVTPSFTGFGTTTLPTNQTAMYRVAGLSAGSHTCTMQGTSTGNIYFVWAAYLSGNPITNGRVVLAGSIPTRGGTFETNDPAWRAFQTSAVSTLNGDGLTRIGYVHTDNLFPNTTEQFTDGALHPVEFNHYLMAGAYLSVYNSILGTHLVQPVYAPVTGSAMPSGNQNINIGLNCLPLNTTGNRNWCVSNALNNNTTGSFNTAVGNLTLAANTTGSENTGVGSAALNANQTGSANTAVGNNALNQVTASGNTGVGNQVMGVLSTGVNNVAVGNLAGAVLSTGNNNTIIGTAAGGANLTTDSGTVFIGEGAIKNGTSFTMTRGGAFGAGALLSADDTWQTGNGNNTQTGTWQFKSNPFLDNSGNGSFTTIATLVGTSIPAGSTITIARDLSHVTGTGAISTSLLLTRYLQRPSPAAFT
jgi:hypothetical protein